MLPPPASASQHQTLMPWPVPPGRSVEGYSGAGCGQSRPALRCPSLWPGRPLLKGRPPPEAASTGAGEGERQSEDLFLQSPLRSKLASELQALKQKQATVQSRLKASAAESVRPSQQAPSGSALANPQAQKLLTQMTRLDGDLGQIERQVLAWAPAQLSRTTPQEDLGGHIHSHEVGAVTQLNQSQADTDPDPCDRDSQQRHRGDLGEQSSWNGRRKSPHVEHVDTRRGAGAGL
nr:uncharacterized protein LOC129017733 isoform X1 [Pongo pygmaeus]